MCPQSGFSWPVIMRKSVVLPAPLGPMMPTIPPGGSEKFSFVHQQLVAVALVDVLGFDHHARPGAGPGGM